MSEKRRINFNLFNDTNNLVNEYSKKSNISKSDFVERAILYFIENEGKDYKGLYEVLNSMFEHIENKIDYLGNEMKKNKKAINDVKNDSNILVQYINDRFISNNVEDITLMEENKSHLIKQIEDNRNEKIGKERTKSVNKI